MELTKSGLASGIQFDHIHTGPEHGAALSINLLYAPDRDTVSLNVLIPHVLCRGTALYASGEALRAYADELGGLSIFPVVRRFGEIYSCGLKMCIPASCGNTDKAAELLCSILLSPATRGGLLDRKYVDEEKELLADSIDASDEDPVVYALRRCCEEMCGYEDYAVPFHGDPSDLRSVYYTRLTKQYRSLLQTCPIEIVYVGPENEKAVSKVLKNALSVMPRGEIDYDIGTDIRMNAVAETPRMMDESCGVSRCRFAVGLRLGECMDDYDFPAIDIFAELLKDLFSAYDVENTQIFADLHKGICILSFSADTEYREKCLDDLSKVIRMIAESGYPDERFAAAREAVSGRISALCGDASGCEEFITSAILSGLDCSPEEYAQAVSETGKADAAAIAASTETDFLFFSAGQTE